MELTKLKALNKFGVAIFHYDTDATGNELLNKLKEDKDVDIVHVSALPLNQEVQSVSRELPMEAVSVFRVMAYFNDVSMTFLMNREAHTLDIIANDNQKEAIEEMVKRLTKI